MKIWHDDIRTPPEPGWTWVRTNKQAIRALLDAELAGIEVTEMSLDHDLGLHECEPHVFDGKPQKPWNKTSEQQAWLKKGDSPDGDGVDLVQAMCALRLVPPKVTVHSWNPDGADRMVGMLEGMSDAEVILRAYEPPDCDDEDRRIMRAMGLTLDQGGTHPGKFMASDDLPGSY